VDDNAAAGDLELSSEDLAQIDAALTGLTLEV
jgi:hypothetical protein